MALVPVWNSEKPQHANNKMQYSLVRQIECEFLSLTDRGLLSALQSNQENGWKTLPLPKKENFDVQIVQIFRRDDILSFFLTSCTAILDMGQTRLKYLSRIEHFLFLVQGEP